jgi:3-hydroxypropanoate dehydrogenase
MLDKPALDLLFNKARTHNDWLDKPVDDALLHQLYDLTKMPPTSANCQPLRIVFVKSEEAKAQLKPHMAEGNIDKTMAAPVTAILAMDMRFHDHLPKWFPHADAKSWFEGNDQLISDTAFRNSTLQGGYFMLAARALGLDCGAMSGFDTDGLDKAFFSGTSFKTNFLCNIGYGDASKLFDQSPRPNFDDCCKIA